MNHLAKEICFYGICVKTLGLYFGCGTTIEGITSLGSRFPQRKDVHPLACLFVRSKVYIDRPMLKLRMLKKISDGRHDFRNAGFIIRSKKSRSICHHNGIPDMLT